MVWERGTNRSAFFKGLVDKYNWQVVGSSFYPSELQAAFLCAQLEQLDENISLRLKLWNCYERLLKPIEEEGYLRILREPSGCEHNAHMLAIMLPNPSEADRLRIHLNENGIQTVIHYVPLHESPVGSELGYDPESLPVTSRAAASLIRLPLHLSMDEEDIEYIVRFFKNFIFPMIECFKGETCCIEQQHTKYGCTDEFYPVLHDFIDFKCRVGEWFSESVKPTA